MFASFGKSNTIVKNGKVINSDIDMNQKVISKHGEPLENTDVVNKTYCDQNTAGVLPVANVFLSSNNWSLALPFVSGALDISVFSTVENGPCGSFLLTKNSPGRHPTIVRTTSTAGSITNERLEVRWGMFSGVELRKTGSLYDGQYRLRYSLNN